METQEISMWLKTLPLTSEITLMHRSAAEKLGAQGKHLKPFSSVSKLYRLEIPLLKHLLWINSNNWSCYTGSNINGHVQQLIHKHIYLYISAYTHMCIHSKSTSKYSKFNTYCELPDHLLKCGSLSTYQISPVINWPAVTMKAVCIGGKSLLC